jgi:hypothetical protein
MTSKTLFKNPEDWTSWLASTGYLFPRNELELARYNKLYQDSEQKRLADSTVSVERILAGRCRLFPAINPFEDQDINQIQQEYRMVARKGQGQLPDHIRAKMKKNEANDDNGLPEKEDQ